jgi:CRISPR-associated helicase Cas3
MSDTSKKKKIKIGSVQFKYADDQPHSVGNDSFRLFPHQAEFFREVVDALDGDESRFLFLESMTGSGKTIANIMPAIERGENILISYPTNQLIEDQKKSIDEDAEDFGFDATTEIISSRELRRESQETGESILDVLNSKLLEAQNDDTTHILLTTPDTLYNILTGKYWGSDEFTEPMKRTQTDLLAAVSYLVFDEFHMYDVSMETSILNMCIVLHHNLGKQLPIIFSSATSDENFKESLSQVSRNQIANITDEQSISDDGDVTICGQIELEVILGNKWNGPEVFADTKEEKIREAVDGGHELTAIFESVKRTSNTISRLREEIPQVEGKWAYRTGIDSNRTPLDKAPLIIGTRTLSVGIDFDTQNLFFESYRARDFLQKLGRVGRGEEDIVSKATGYTSEYSFPELDEMDSYYENKKKLKHDLIGEGEKGDGKMAEQGKMWGYSQDHGPIELDNMSQDFPGVDEESLFKLSHDIYRKSPYADESRPWLEDFLMAFRDPGVPQVAIANEEGIRLQEVMMFLEQRSTDLQEDKSNLVPEDEFLREHSEKSPVVAEYIKKGTVKPLLFYDSAPQKDTSGSIQLRVTNGIDAQGLLRYPQDTNFRMEISGEDLHGKLTREIADRMFDRDLLIYLVSEERFKDLYVPHLFKTYELEAARGEKYRVAFGQNALKLDAHKKRCSD